MKETLQAILADPDAFYFKIYKDGVIASANKAMINKFQLSNPCLQATNFFDLVHPFHLNTFKKAMHDAETGALEDNIEIYIKNGFYHPMKWKVSFQQEKKEEEQTFLCVGYNILDDERLNHFNQLVRKHYQLIIEGISGVLFHDRNGHLIAANQKAAEIFDSSLERLYQLTNVEELWNNQWNITDESGNRVCFESAPFKKALCTGQPQKQTLIIELASGEKRHILFSSQAIPDEDNDGQLTVISNLIDVTRERILVKQLIEQQSLVSSFLNQTPHLAWVVDDDGALHFASSAFCRHFGVEESECIGKKVTDLVPDSVVQALYKYHLDVFSNGDSIETTEKIKWADGSQFVAHINMFLIKGAGGKDLVGGQAVVMPDKSGLEKDLHFAHQRLITLSRATSDAIWEWDMQTGQIFRNETLMEMVGYSLDDSRGLSWWLRRIHPEDRNRVADKVKEATDSCQQSWEDEYRFKCADGSYKHVQDKGFVVYENGLPVKMIGSIHDISTVKDLQNKLADIRLLQQKEISETVIRVQEKERTQIGYELHDNVNQLLSTAMLFLDMLETDNKEQLQIKKKTNEYLRIAVEEIRKLSKELVTPKLKDEKLTDSIQVMVDDIKFAGVIDIRFTHDSDSNQLAPGKKLALFRILQEQLKNIIKHSDAKEVQILLHTRNGVTELIIEDNGKGFNSHMAHKGIGLSNMRERTLFYDGEVSINTSPGNGCQLIVTIPFND